MYYIFESLMCDGVYDVFDLFFLFKQNTAYYMRSSDWSSDVCSADPPWDGAFSIAMPPWCASCPGLGFDWAFAAPPSSVSAAAIARVFFVMETLLTFRGLRSRAGFRPRTQRSVSATGTDRKSGV